MAMEGQQTLLGDDGGATSISNSATTTLSVPFTSLNSGDHWIFIPDCGPHQLDGYEDLPLADCGYSKPFVVLDIIWNLAFVLVSVFVLLSTVREKPSTPLRVWIGGYALQCLWHLGCVYFEYQRRNQADLSVDDGLSLSKSHSSIVKRLESINTVISSIWWVFGFYWIVVGGQALLQDSPRLYWLAVVFLAFDVFFMIFCIAMACIIFFALFCCFPILATIAYAMAIGEGASENDIRTLPKYNYRQGNPLRTFDNEREQEFVGITVEAGNSNSTAEFTLHPEDSECCICLYRYVDGAELCSLPCNHHFHYGCISKWLRINATCPLCKFNILGGD
ncbi:hypothetical protein F0562_015317 [Nyssa sinensis]|uniref:RING-type E3 ubiquitin transferase n=1 Tax=Nyssa sinensis TaxID=561372 RepID=A0A5J4ZGP4_9ASTE|nr:hypothetical protein F0562_015317 [Nyssa sinensis]